MKNARRNNKRVIYSRWENKTGHILQVKHNACFKLINRLYVIRIHIFFIWFLIQTSIPFLYSNIQITYLTRTFDFEPSPSVFLIFSVRNLFIYFIFTGLTIPTESLQPSVTCIDAVTSWIRRRHAKFATVEDATFWFATFWETYGLEVSAYVMCVC